jgi:hypothetical protein
MQNSTLSRDVQIISRCLLMLGEFSGALEKQMESSDAPQKVVFDIPSKTLIRPMMGSILEQPLVPLHPSKSSRAF